MHLLAQFLLTIILTFLFQTYLPWWTMLIAAAVSGFIFYANRSRKSFVVGFLAVGILYTGMAIFSNQLNEGVFAAKIENVWGEGAYLSLFAVPALLGGLLGGFGSMTGNLFRRLFSE